MSDSISADLSQTKNRITGAIIWLAALVIIVPIWYNNPVNFVPEGTESSAATSEEIVQKAYKLSKDNQQQPSDAASANVSKQISKPPVSAVVQLDTKEKPVTKTERVPTKKVAWTIGVAAFEDKTDAEALMQRLKYDYDAYIKYFPKNKYYSVRIGPYADKSEAMKEKDKLDNVLRTDSKLVKISQPQ
jgi:DedD protein